MEVSESIGKEGHTCWLGSLRMIVPDEQGAIRGWASGVGRLEAKPMPRSDSRSFVGPICGRLDQLRSDGVHQGAAVVNEHQAPVRHAGEAFVG